MVEMMPCGRKGGQGGRKEGGREKEGRKKERKERKKKNKLVSGMGKKSK